MTAQSQADLLTRANQVRTETAGFANTASRLGSLFRDIIDTIFGSGIGGKYSVVNYGASSTGGNDPSVAFAEAAAKAAATGGSVYVPRGTYGNGGDWSFALPSGVALEGDGDASVLRNCYVTCAGSAGAEIPLTSPAAKGDSTISIPATGLSGAWLRLASCINMNSSDAGRDQLGHVVADMGFLSEFTQVLVGGVSSATLSGGTTWPYSNTPGGDSGSFTTSVARIMTFHEGAAIRNLKFLGKNSVQNQNIQATFCKGLRIEGVTCDSNDITNQCIRFLYCLDSHVRDTVLIGKRTSVPAGSTANPLVILSSQGCTATGLSVYYGGQGVDISNMISDSTYRGGPSINCGVSDSQAFECSNDGFTSHWGCYGSFFENVRAKGCSRGVRVRDRGSSVRGAKLIGRSATGGIGVLVDNAAVSECEVTGCDISGYLEGIVLDHSAAGYEALELLLGGSLTVVHRNRIRDCSDHGIYLSDAYTSAVMVGPRIEHNDVQNCGNDAIQVNSYWNGAIIDGNRVTTVPAGIAGIRWNANVKRLWVGENHIYGVNATGLALRGPSTSSFMTDTTTFPLGEPEAFLYIGRQFTDASSGLVFGSIIRNVAAYTPGRVTGFGALLSPLSNAGPTVERQTVGFYQRLGSSVGQTLLADVRDASNAVTTHQMVMRTSAADPNSVLTGNVGDIAVSSLNGSVWRKTSGTNTNTGWVTP